MNDFNHKQKFNFRHTCVFGASVTAQKNSYAKYLSNSPAFGKSFSIFGYGGMHLNNAARCFLPSVLTELPSICILEWFSTSYNDCNITTINILNELIFKCSTIMCTPVFLFLPRAYDKQKIDFQHFCIEYLATVGANVVDLTNSFSVQQINTLLRDGIHTTDSGSSVLSENILDYFESSFATTPNINSIDYTYRPIKSMTIEREFHDQISLNGDCDVIGFFLTIGPYSGLVNLKHTQNESYANIWDKWCYFTRNHFNLQFKLTTYAKITVLNDTLDTSSSKQSLNFNSFRKKLVVHSIFYESGEISAINASESRKINYLYLFSLSAVAKLRRLYGIVLKFFKH
jgi:hypothetical protein